MATQYRWKDLLDKAIYINQDAKLYRNAADNEIPYATIKKGTPVGNLYSWVNAKKGRSVDWLVFIDKTDKFYYVPVKLGTFDLAALKAQGVKTAEEQSKQEENKTKKDAGIVSYYIEKYVPYILGVIVAIPILKSIINKTIK